MKESDEHPPLLGITSGQLAKAAGVHVETLRYYEREGLLAEPRRSEGNYRLYDTADVQTVSFIRKAQGAGFSLADIGQLLALRGDPRHSAGEVKALALQRITSIEDKISHLEAVKAELQSLVNACSGEGSADNCPILCGLELPIVTSNHHKKENVS